MAQAVAFEPAVQTCGCIRRARAGAGPLFACCRMPEVGAVGPDRGLETMPGLLCTRAENCCTGQSVDRVSRVLGGGAQGAMKRCGSLRVWRGGGGIKDGLGGNAHGMLILESK